MPISGLIVCKFRPRLAAACPLHSARVDALADLVRRLTQQSIQELEDLLSRASVATIRTCIHDRPPCAVTRLAVLICEALPLWAYTSHILRLLCNCYVYSRM